MSTSCVAGAGYEEREMIIESPHFNRKIDPSNNNSLEGLVKRALENDQKALEKLNTDCKKISKNIESLLKQDEIVTLFAKACQYKAIQLGNTLCEMNKWDGKKLFEAARATVEYDKIELLKAILRRKEFDPSLYDSQLFIEAACKGRLEIVKRLSGCKKINQSAQEDEAFCQACAQGRLAVVKYLIDLPTIQLNSKQNFALRKACENGYLDIVEALLEYEDIDVAACENESIRLAAANGHIDIVKLLLKEKNVDPGAYENEAVRLANQNGHASIVALLRAHPKVDASMIMDLT